MHAPHSHAPCMRLPCMRLACMRTRLANSHTRRPLPPPPPRPARRQWTMDGAPYTKDGRMLFTQPWGIMECDEGCGETEHCKHNNQVGAPAA